MESWEGAYVASALLYYVELKPRDGRGPQVREMSIPLKQLPQRVNEGDLLLRYNGTNHWLPVRKDTRVPAPLTLGALTERAEKPAEEMHIGLRRADGQSLLAVLNAPDSQDAAGTDSQPADDNLQTQADLPEVIQVELLETPEKAGPPHDETAMPPPPPQPKPPAPTGKARNEAQTSLSDDRSLNSDEHNSTANSRRRRHRGQSGRRKKQQRIEEDTERNK